MPARDDYIRSRSLPDERARVFGEMSPTTTQNSPATVGVVAGDSTLSDEGVIAAASQIETVQWVSRAFGAWGQMDDANKIAYWDRLTPVEQNLLRANAGIEPPTRNRFLRSIQKGVGIAFRNNPITLTAKGVLHGFGVVDRAKNHYVRANLRMREEAGDLEPTTEGNVLGAMMPGGGATAGLLASYVPASLNPSTWRKFWDQTSNGEGTFWNDAIERARDEGLEGEDLELAKMLAEYIPNATLADDEASEELLRQGLDSAMLQVLTDQVEAGETTQEQAAVDLQGFRERIAGEADPLVKAARHLVNGRISTGRAMAMMQGYEPGTSAFSWASGAGDFANAFIDIDLAGGLALKAVRVGRFGVTRASRFSSRATRIAIERGGSHAVAARAVRSAYRPVLGESATEADVVTNLTRLIREEGAETVLQPSVRRWTSKVSDALNEEVARGIQAANEGTTARTLGEALADPANAERYGVARLITEEPKFADIIDELAAKVGVGTMDRMVSNGLAEITEEGIQAARRIDDADILGVMADRMGVKAILSGRMGGHLYHRPLMPHISTSHLPWRKVKNMMRAGIDWADDSPMRVWEKLRKAGDLTDEEWQRVLDSGGVRFGLREAAQVAGKMHPVMAGSAMAWTTLGRLAKNITTTSPATVIDLMGRDSITQVQRFAAYLPRRMGNELVDQFAASRSAAQRYLVIKSMMEEIFTRTGVRDAKGGAEWANDFLRKLDAENGHIFALDGLDQFAMPNGERIPAAINLLQTSSKVQLPNLKELWRFSTQAGFWSNVTGSRIFNKDAFDVFMGRMWSPLVLMRMGFPIRAGGDEAIQFAMREGFGAYLKGRIAASAVSDKPVLDPIWKSLRFMHERMAKNSGWYAGSVQSLIDFNDMKRFYGVYRASDTIKRVADLGHDVVRSFQRTLTPEHYVEAAALLYRHSDAVVSRHLSDFSASAQGGHLYRFREHMSDHERALRIHEVADDLESFWNATRFTGKWGEFDVSENADLFFNHYRNRMLEMRESPDSKVLLEVLDSRLDDVMGVAKEMDGPTLQRFGQILDSHTFRRQLVDEWMARVQGTELEDQIFNRVLRSGFTRDGRVVVTGNIADIPEEFLDKWASREEALWHYAHQQYDLLRQRIFTLPTDGKVPVPIPGITKRLLDESDFLDLDELKRLKYNPNSIGDDLAEAYDLRVPATRRMPESEEELAQQVAEDHAYLVDQIYAEVVGDPQILGRETVEDWINGEAGDLSEELVARMREVRAFEIDEMTKGARETAHGRTSFDLPGRTTGPLEEPRIKNFRDVADSLLGKMVDKPMEVMGMGINYISRDPMFIHYLAEGVQVAKETQWVNRTVQRALLDDLAENLDGSPLTYATPTQSLDVKGVFEGASWDGDGLDEIKRRMDALDPDLDFRWTDNPRAHGSYWMDEDGIKHIQINLETIDGDYDTILRWIETGEDFERGIGSIVHFEKYQRMGIDQREVFEWMRDNGGVERYREFVIAHEMGHLRLDHKAKLTPEGEIDVAYLRERGLHDFSIGKEIAADQFAFDALDMPFKSRAETLRFEDSKDALDYLERIAARGEYARRNVANMHIDYDEMLRTDDLGEQMLAIANRSGFTRLQGEGDYAFTKRVFERTWEAEGEVFEVAFEHAINNAMPYVDSVPVASFMARWGRNMVPFWWAEERFLKRLAQSIYHSPEGLWKAQLLYKGLRNTGVIKTDENGSDYFIYPGNAMAHYVTAAMLNFFTGEDYSVPQYEQISGRTLMSLPGLDEMGRPSPGPLVALPMRLLRSRFPEIDGVIDPVLGDYAASETVGNWELILPSTLVRAWRAWSPEQAKSHYASAHLQAMQVLLANGHDMVEDPTTGQLVPEHPEDFSERAERLTHIIATMRVIYGFAGFAPPEVSFPEANEARDRLFELTNALGWTEGLAEWDREFPNATAYQVFSTETAGGTSLPATRETFEFMEGNEEFLSRHRHAAPYLIPKPEADSEFYPRAWTKQMALELRTRRTDEEMYRAVKFAEAAPHYFETQAQYEQARALYKGTEYAAIIDNRWSKWQDNYFAMYPTFMDELIGDERDQRRREILRELGDAFTNPDLPITDQTANLKQFYDGLMTFKQAMDEVSGFNTKPYLEYRAQLRERMLVWSDWMVQAYPHLEDFYLRVVLPEMSLNQTEASEMIGATSG